MLLKRPVFGADDLAFAHVRAWPTICVKWVIKTSMIDPS